MNDLVWKAPPPDQPSKAVVTAALLRAKPGEWAMIVTNGPFQLLPWWNPLAQRKDLYEFKVVLKDKTQLFGLRDVYMRYIGEEKND